MDLQHHLQQNEQEQHLQNERKQHCATADKPVDKT